jgi:hypothetical protein
VRQHGYGVYRHRGRLHGCFLEFDCGTFSARDYDGFPTILVVTIDNTTEERIAGAVRAASVGHAVAPPVLITCTWRIDDPRNAAGLLGPIWRKPDAEFRDRRTWPSHPTKIASTSLSPYRPWGDQSVQCCPGKG